MATTNRVYILVALLFSGIAAIFNIVSLSTEEWISGKAVLVQGNSGTNSINYGLFQGNYKTVFPSSNNYELTMTCSLKNNVCALLCGLDAEERINLLNSLYKGDIDSSYAMNNCSSTVRKVTYYNQWPFQNTPVRANSNTNISPTSFINAGVWISTLIFLILAGLLGFIAAVLALYNSVTNPIQYFLSVKSLFVYNAAAFACTLLCMILWGTLYNLRIFHNVGIYDTIAGSITSDKTAYLGYSYWICFVALIFYAASIAILYYREYLNERDPRQKKMNLDADSNDPNLYLY